MRVLVLIVVVMVALVGSSGCDKSNKAQRDILLEVAESFDEMFDTPKSKGQAIYSQFCSVCHGLSGEGDGFNAYNLNPKPRAFTDSAFVTRLDRALVVETITNGGKAIGISANMPPWGNTLSSYDIDLVASHVIRLSKSSVTED